MSYLSGGLFHQNKFPVKFIGPNLFFPWLLNRCACPRPLPRHLHQIHILYAEAVVPKCSSKYVFFKILQISQENTWIGISFQ